MIVVPIIDGWSASSRPFHLRLKTAAMKVLPHDAVVLAKRALFSKHRSATFRRFVVEHDHSDNVLLACGKSLGAKVLVDDVLNWLGPLSYRKVLILTIDPNWPTLKDWTPNLNRCVLQINRPFSRAINVVLVAGSPSQQAGAILSGPCGDKVENRMVHGTTHRDIVDHPEVSMAFINLIEEALLT